MTAGFSRRVVQLGVGLVKRAPLTFSCVCGQNGLKVRLCRGDGVPGKGREEVGGGDGFAEGLEVPAHRFVAHGHLTTRRVTLATTAPNT